MRKLQRVVFGIPLLIASLGCAQSETQDAAQVSSPPVESGKGRTVTLRVFNYAHVSSGHLAKGEDEASCIFRRVGLEVRWVNYLPAAKDGHMAVSSQGDCKPADLFLSILSPEEWAAVHRRHTHALGFAAVPEEGARSSWAYISWSEVESESQRVGTDREEDYVLGCVMAHEIGHLLLRTTRHTLTGLMRAHWGQNEMRLATQRYLRFTPTEARLLRAEVAARALAPAAQTAALRRAR
ncbi:MAG: hypothetical protein LAP13_20760 [Acidobacteriia bacterium]|nr:hypothetical protein [Terriglobia bacterium]